ncbi:MAG TPA: YqgE/AlgH family protein [Coxiellaceae bacterium]|nr:MAG: hypothetical protein A3E81_05240 [Gammaproteobacteria bacterium RIFCSPHIGHO2_12_FULL_36_30]HLB55836.1 YqgE/AlgH family protein [Coxiellaceae bacterium]
MRINNFKNQFLIAMPSMTGEFFGKSVVYIYEHSEKGGAIGFTINKPLSATLGNVLEHLNIKVEDKASANLPVYSGGPVGPDQGFVIHDRMSLAENKETGEVCISTTREILQEIADKKGPDHFMVMLGYSGWEPGQLEKEIQRNDWLVAPFKKDILFQVPIAQRWVASAKSLGVDLTKLSSQVGHA